MVRKCTVGRRLDRARVLPSNGYIQVQVPDTAQCDYGWYWVSLSPGEFRKLAAAGLQMCKEIEAERKV